MNVMRDVIFVEGGGTPILRFFLELCSPSAGGGSAQQGHGKAAIAPQQQLWQQCFFYSLKRKPWSVCWRPISILRAKHFISAVIVEQQGRNGLCFGKVTQGLLAANLQTSLKKKRIWGGQEKGGCRCLHIELLLVPFLLSFWKVSPRSEAISRERCPCWCVHRRLLLPLPSRKEWARDSQGKSAQTAHKTKVWRSERSITEQNLKKKSCFIAESYFKHIWCLGSFGRNMSTTFRCFQV